MKKVFLTSLLLAAACVHQDGVVEPDPAPVADAHFICTGTEPFWSLELKEGEAILKFVTMAPEPERTDFAGGWANIDEDEGRYEWSGARQNGRAFDVTVTRASCLGTRDEPYDYQSSYGTTRAYGEVEPGCCVRK